MSMRMTSNFKEDLMQQLGSSSGSTPASPASSSPSSLAANPSSPVELVSPSKSSQRNSKVSVNIPVNSLDAAIPSTPRVGHLVLVLNF